MIEETADEEKYSKKIRRNRAADIIFLVIAGLMSIVSIYEIIFVGVFTIREILSLIWAALLILNIIKGRKRFFWLLLAVNMLWAMYLGFCWLFPSSFYSKTQWRYKYQVIYVTDIRKNGHADCFPDELPSELSDYRIDYAPSIWQGTGHFRVHFKTSAKQLEQYEKEYSTQAIYTIPVSDFNGMWDTQVKEISPKAGVSHGDDKSLMVTYDQDYWAGHEKDATVYVVSAVHNWNHPHSGAVIINKTDKMVEFTHLG